MKRQQFRALRKVVKIILARRCLQRMRDTLLSVQSRRLYEEQAQHLFRSAALPLPLILRPWEYLGQKEADKEQ